MIHKSSNKTLLILLLLSLLALPNVPAASAASATDTDSGLPIRTTQQIAALWRQNMNPQADIQHPFITAPSVSNPYAPGALRGDYIQDGLNALNFYRFISGLPADLEVADELNLKAQYGSVLLASEGKFGHTPPQPAHMPDDFYKQGYSSTTSANIYASYGYNDHILFHSVEAYMEDSDTSNLDRVGHRRWVLNPPMKQVGMGLAKGPDDFSYTALQIFDKSRAETVDYHYIPYPAQGPFPVEVFGPTDAWSVSVNPKEFEKPSLESVTVTLTRLRDNRSWKLDAGNNKVTEKGAYFNTENNAYGTGSAIIFRPDGVDVYRPGDTYQVRIDGLTGKDGSAKTIAYTVDFMSAKADPSVPMPKFTDISRHWARQTIDWSFGQGIASGYPDGSFKPDNRVTEQEFVKMFSVATGAKVEATHVWSDAYYQFAMQHHFALNGLNNPIAKAKPINRLAVAELLASAAGDALSGNSAVQFLLDHGYSKGKTAATVQGFHGSDNLTRAEAVQFIKNALDAKFTLPL
jgi:uncharacterized protein YkwD